MTIAANQMWEMSSAISMQQSFKEQGCYGICMYIGGRLGEFIKAKTTWFFGLPKPHEAKARGLKEAIK